MATVGSALIRVSRVEKTYGSGDVAMHALRGLSVDIGSGEFVVVLGPSGSGKTTLMDLVGGIERPTGGTIEVAGQALAGLDDAALTEFRRRNIGFVFQFFNLIPTLTALENVQLVAELAGFADTGAALAALTAVGLADRADRFPAALSGGEQQRVAIARAVVKDPPILLCDEPTGSLDLETGRTVLSALRSGGSTTGRTVLLVTHNSAIAAIADRVIQLRSGTIAQDRRVAAPADPASVTW
jgi:putative ABC transport system ATP-binding protein